MIMIMPFLGEAFGSEVNFGLNFLPQINDSYLHNVRTMKSLFNAVTCCLGHSKTISSDMLFLMEVAVIPIKCPFL